MLRFESISKRYGDIQALDGASFSVPRGALLGFLGPNGAGKTTAMRTVFGLVRPDAGSVTWGGAPITPAMRLDFGYMPEQRGLYPRMRIAKQLAFFGQLHGLAKQEATRAAHDWLERFGLSDRTGDRLEDLSHGNQQRVQLAAALVHQPALLVLDEPFSGLDPLGVASMTDVLRDQASGGTAVVFSSHQLDLVEDICDSVVVIHRGAIVLDGLVVELRTASPHRYVEIDADNPNRDWYESIDGVQLVDPGPPLTLRVPAHLDPKIVLASAIGDGDLRHFAFSPPSLSQVFREAVGQ